MEIEVKIKGLMIDPINNMPIVILRDPKSDSVLPIWVGIFEANAIAQQLENVLPPRPMTHDLLRDVIRGLSARISRIVITDLKDNTFYALIHVENAAGPLTIDSRPSDAIALALRASAPIFVDSDVLEKAKNVDLSADSADNDRMRKWLETLDEKELGKYEM